jgi:hypothetical protein
MLMVIKQLRALPLNENIGVHLWRKWNHSQPVFFAEYGQFGKQVFHRPLSGTADDSDHQNPAVLMLVADTCRRVNRRLVNDVCAVVRAALTSKSAAGITRQHGALSQRWQIEIARIEIQESASCCLGSRMTVVQ